MDNAFQIVAKLEDFQHSGAREAKLQDLHLALFLADGKIYAVENNCPHQHFEVLHQGHLEGCTITCPMHGRTFDLESGNCLNGAGKLRKFELKVVGNDVLVQKPTETRFTMFDT
jgi:nitrite reductase/ring-hydroxylating ferredoxin subunit